MKYSVITFGCRVNQADSLGFEEELLRSGALASSSEEADLVSVAALLRGYAGAELVAAADHEHRRGHSASCCSSCACTWSIQPGGDGEQTV